MMKRLALACGLGAKVAGTVSVRMGAQATPPPPLAINCLAARSLAGMPYTESLVATGGAHRTPTPSLRIEAACHRA
jgi:hypothetical protein